MSLGERFKKTSLNKMADRGNIADQTPVDPGEKTKSEIASRIKSLVMAVDSRAARAIGFKGNILEGVRKEATDNVLSRHQNNDGDYVVGGEDEKGTFIYRVGRESIYFVLTKPQVLATDHKKELKAVTSADFSSFQITKKQYHSGGDLTGETLIWVFNSDCGLNAVILQRKGLFRTDGSNFSTLTTYTDPDLTGNIVLQFPVIGLNKMREQIFEAEKVLDPEDGPKIVIHSSKGSSDIKGLIVGEYISFRADNSPGFSVKTKENISENIDRLIEGFIRLEVPANY